MLWGLVRTIPNIGPDGLLNCLHDAALWYYALFAVLFVAASKVIPDLPDRIIRGFGRVIPYVLLWMPIAVLGPKLGIRLPDFPTADVPALAHDIGNAEVVLAICLGYLWLVPDTHRSQKSRLGWSLLALITLAVSATQNRGGAVAALAAGFVGFLVMHSKRSALIALAKGIAIAGLLLGIAWTTNVTIHTSKRDISVDQLIANTESVAGGSQLHGTIAWREHLWTTVISKEYDSGKIAIGFGMGPNLALIAGVPEKQATNPALQLRSPHDSHIDVLGRMGIIGALMWAVLWIGWGAALLRARKWFIHIGDEYRRSILELCLLAIVGILTDCIFVPTLEAAQVACLAWTVYGLGIVTMRQSQDSSVEALTHGS